jgi:hypothetical protein
LRDKTNPTAPNETRHRSSRLNGWRRLWLALTVFAAIIAVLGGFLQGGGSGGSWQYDQAVRNEFDNPACVETATRPFNQLVEPEFDSEGKGGCWHIYTHRQFQSDPDRILTMELYRHDQTVYIWKSIGVLSAIYLAMVLIGSAIVYALGKTVAWIRVGFRST